jgi:multidrug efflux system membrane fusion protein
MHFRDDPGAKRSAWIAGALVILVVGWFGSGLLISADSSAPQPVEGARAAVEVSVMRSVAGRVAEALILEGQAMPERETLVPAEASGRVIEVLVDKGVHLDADDIIARLESARLGAALRRAEAEYERASREHENAQALLQRGIGTVDRVAEAHAVLAAAEAQLAADREALDDTEIRAPFAGRLEDLSVNDGEFVPEGTPVARIVDNTPLTVRARVAQQSVSRVEAGQAARVNFITGESRMGIVSFVGAHADPETRTFLLEVEIANEDGAIPSGVSARIVIETGERRAHFVSPALFALDERGVLGLKTVEEDGRVAFHTVDVVKAETGGVWVAGLPDEVTLITVGQGFVRSGEQVTAQPDPRSSAHDLELLQ